MKRLRWSLAVGSALSLAAVAGALAAVPGLRWRTQLIAMHAAGRIPDIAFVDLVRYMAPGPQQHWLEPLVESGNPYAVIRNTRVSPADLQIGARIYRNDCAGCHGLDAGGGARGPGLVRRGPEGGRSDWAIYRKIRYGVPDTGMAPHPLGDDRIWQVIGFLQSLNPDTSSEVAEASAQVQVSSDEIASIHKTGDEWLTYSGSYSSWRHSGLTSITVANVDKLALRWIYNFGNSEIQASPLMRAGHLFVTEPPNRILCVDARSGREIWSYKHQLDPRFQTNQMGMVPNRGATLLNTEIFFGTADAHLVALNASTGQRIWESAVADPNEYYISGAPLAYRDLVVTGAATRTGGQGFIVALDAKTGKERWRFVVIPKAGQPGSETWAGESGKEGGGPTWITGSYDPDLDILVWGVGNPKPDYDDFLRKGDNLYTNSAVALKGSTGEMLWHFQFTPADNHDWDSNQMPVLADYPTPRGVEKRVLWANRNGFYYALDRSSGRFLMATPFVRQTWTTGIDPAGRPIPLPSRAPSREGMLLYPGSNGATNWWPPSYDPAQDLMFVPALEQGMVYFASKGSWPVPIAGQSFYTAVRALSGSTGKLVWEYRNSPRHENTRTGGLLSTASGLLFGSDAGTFFALQSRTGKRLWSVQAGGKITSPPITYALDGEQFVIITAGRNLLGFSLPMPALAPLDTKGESRHATAMFRREASSAQ